ncbi:MAG TPA: hypothetical protein PKH94_02015 [Bacteroidales bacterium]|nr:hypothetical protein [Bacteroidales bacterium]HNS45994.1 hypothetical protein [Bacteroidales bacterium]
MRGIKRYGPFTLILWMCAAGVLAQPTDEFRPASGTEFIEWVTDAYGSDDLLVSGSIYIPSSPLIDRHPFFEREEWFNGTVYVEGRRFDRQEISYDLTTKKMILNAVFKEGATVRIVLNSWKMDSLYLDDHLFINNKHLALGEQDTAFYELIHRNGFTFVSGYHKEYIRKYSASTPHGLWSQQASRHYIHTGQWYPVYSTKSLLAFFPSGKDQIRRFLHKNHIRYRKATSSQIKLLLDYCSQFYPSAE